MGKDKDKTNVMRILDRHKISYRHFGYDSDGTHTGVEIADMLHEDADRVFKTLVTEGKAGEPYVFVIPVGCELDLKKAAKARRQQGCTYGKIKGASPFDRVHSRRMFSYRNEKDVYYCYSRKRRKI